MSIYLEQFKNILPQLEDCIYKKTYMGFSE